MKKSGIVSRLISVLTLCAVIAAVLLSSGCSKSVLDPDNPVSITIWHYYNAQQKVAFDDMVREFNNTVGSRMGIYVNAISHGGVNDLAEKIIQSAEGETGADPMPDIFLAYPDTAYIVDRLGYICDVTPYMTKKELGEYLPAFLEEGIMPNETAYKIFPTAKSTEVLMLNRHVWDEFKAETPDITDDCLFTWEGICDAAEKFYFWTDSKTPDIPNDGHALFGLDSLANFIIIGARQLGVNITDNQNGTVKYNIAHDALKKIWNVYYDSYVRGYFSSSNRYRSDDLKIGVVSSYIGSTTGGAYFPAMITSPTGKEEPAELFVARYPTFKGASGVAIQQGAGMIVTVSNEQKQTASVEFLKWFTDIEQNMSFAVESGYFPVKTDALFGDAMEETIQRLKTSDNINEKNTGLVFETAIEQFDSYTTYYTQPFEKSFEFRNLINDSLFNAGIAGREAFDKALADGKTREEAFAAADSDANFELWYNQLTAFTNN